MVDRVKSSSSIRILGHKRASAVMKTALCSKDLAYLNLPRKFQESVELEDVIHCNIRRNFIQIWSIQKCACPLHKMTGATDEGAGFIGFVIHRINNYRHCANKAIRRQRIDSQLVIRFVCESVIATQGEAPRQSFCESDHKTIVITVIPWTKGMDRSRRKWCQEGSNPDSGLEANVGLAISEHIVHLAMIVIRFDHNIPDLSLHADANTACIGRFECSIDVSGKELSRYCGMSQCTKRTPEKETIWFSDGCRSLR